MNVVAGLPCAVSRRAAPHTATVEKLQALGLSSITKQGVPLSRLRLFDESGCIGTLDFDAVTARRGGSGCVVGIASRSLHELLWNAVTETPSQLLSLRHNMGIEQLDVVSLGEDGDRVHARMAGGAEAARSAMFHAVIGADGVGSRVRTLGYPVDRYGIKTLYCGWGYWHTIMHVPDGLAFDPTEAVQLILPGRMMRMIPVAPDKIFLMGTVTRKVPEPPPLSHDQRRDEFVAHYADVKHALARPLLKNLADTRSQFVQLRYPAHVAVNAYAAGPLALIGNAAHATVPAFSQGTSLAIDSAVSVADALAAVLSPAPAAMGRATVAQALAAWNAQRHEQTRAYQAFCLNTANQIQAMQTMGWMQRALMTRVLRSALTDDRLTASYERVLSLTARLNGARN